MKVMESLSGLTAATMDPSGETATADEETAPARGGWAVEVGDDVGMGTAGGAGVGRDVAVGVGSRVAVGVCTTVGSEVGDGCDVAVGVDVGDGPVHATSISPSVANKGIAARPEGIRIISSSCRYPRRPW